MFVEAFQCLLYSIGEEVPVNPTESLVHVFATFLLLSYSKILFVSFNLLMSTQVINSMGETVDPIMLYYDAAIHYFGHEHLPFALLAIFMLVIFIILPLFVLVLYPTQVFQRCLNCCGIRWHAVHAFADAFNGCYKDGTKGTWDYRYFAGFYLFLRILSIPCVNCGPFGSQLVPSFTIAALLLFALSRPYKNNIFNILDSVLLSLLVASFTVLESTVEVIGPVLPLLYFFVYVMCKILLKMKCQCFLKFKDFVDQMTGDHKLLNNREVQGNGQAEDNDLPDRMINPEEYGLLSEENEDPEQCDTHRISVATYGVA